MKTPIITKPRGFTLIEIMITVGILAVVSAFALPAYEKQAQKSRRADGIATLMDVAAKQERYLMDNSNVYTSTLTSLGYSTSPVISQKGYYSVAASVPTNGLTYTLTATAQNGQENDVCGNLTLTSAGVRGSSASSNCW